MIRKLVLVSILFIATSASAATLDQALSCGRRGEAGGLAAGDDLRRRTIDVRRYPDAVCNDATPAVFYVSPHTRAEDRNKWVIFLQGGGGCGGGEECVSRWCSSGTNFGMDKMTSSLTKPSIRGDGIFDRRDSNRFGGWNHVLVYYCSSDNWAGNKLSRLSASRGGPTPVAFDVHFRGSQIVAAVIDTLRKEGVRPRPARPAAGKTLPDLDEATDVIFAGSSAGGGGVRNNADFVGATLRANNVRCREQSTCPLVYRAAVDASFGPSWEHLDFAGTKGCAVDPTFCSYESMIRGRYESTVVATWGARFDDSCVSWHQANAPGTEWRCADGEHLFANHISSEMFARQDLQDRLLTGNFVEAGLGTAEQFGVLQEADLHEFPTIHTRAEEGPSAAGGKSVAVFAPQCTDHESFTSNRAFYDVKVEQRGAAYSFHDVLWNWWSGAQPQVVIRPFSGSAGAAGECP